MIRPRTAGQSIRPGNPLLFKGNLIATTCHPPSLVNSTCDTGQPLSASTDISPLGYLALNVNALWRLRRKSRNMAARRTPLVQHAVTQSYRPWLPLWSTACRA